jgi:hypothetical protein
MRLNPRWIDKLVRASLLFQAFFTVGILVAIVLIVFVRGIPHINAEFIFSYPEDMGRHWWYFPSIVVCFLALLSIAFAAAASARPSSLPVPKGNAHPRDPFRVESLAGIPRSYTVFRPSFRHQAADGLVAHLGHADHHDHGVAYHHPNKRRGHQAVPVTRMVSFSLRTKWETVTRVVLPGCAGHMTGIMLMWARCQRDGRRHLHHGQLAPA